MSENSILSTSRKKFVLGRNRNDSIWSKTTQNRDMESVYWTSNENKICKNSTYLKWYWHFIFTRNWNFRQVWLRSFQHSWFCSRMWKNVNCKKAKINLLHLWNVFVQKNTWRRKLTCDFIKTKAWWTLLGILS